MMLMIMIIDMARNTISLTTVVHLLVMMLVTKRTNNKTTYRNDFSKVDTVIRATLSLLSLFYYTELLSLFDQTNALFNYR